MAQVCGEATAVGGIAQVANDNCPGQVVISGDRAGMEAAMAALAAAGAKKVMPLAVSIAAHSPLMQPAAEGMATALASSTIVAPQIPVYGNTTARPLTTAGGGGGGTAGATYRQRALDGECAGDGCRRCDDLCGGWRGRGAGGAGEAY